VPESEQLKFLQRQLHRKKEGSKRYYRLRNQIRREYEHLSNKKTDESNKLIHYLKINYDIIYFQDEMISKWKKEKRSYKTGRKCGFSFGKQVQKSYLGRVKAKLVSLEKDNDTFKIPRNLPTTKFCPQCGCLNAPTLADRIYNCSCGYSCDRDVHAARNVKLFGSTKRAECLEQASAETLASMVLNISLIPQAKSMKRKQKADNL
jgi:putative transposase